MKRRAAVPALAASPLALASALLAVAALVGCTRPGGGATSGTFPSLPDAGPGLATPQRVEVEIDGRRMVFVEGAGAGTGEAAPFPATASFGDGGRSLTLALKDPEGRFALVLTVRGTDGEAVQAGRHAAAQCPPADPGAPEPPCSARGSAAVLGLPAGLDDDGRTPATFLAWDAPALGLSPAAFDVESLEETVRPAEGPARRLRGRFSGDFAAIRRDDAGRARVTGPVHRVTGRVDLYASLR